MDGAVATAMVGRKPFRNSIGYIPPDRPKARPKSLGDAKRLVRQVYDENGWATEECGRYQKSLGLPELPVEMLGMEAVKAVLEDLEQARMILLETDE